MKHKPQIFVLLCLLVLVGAGTAFAVDSVDVVSADVDGGKAPVADVQVEAPLRSERSASVSILRGSETVSLDYRVKMDSCVITNENDGKDLARIYYTSYQLASGDHDRPVTFFFNGGPGAASVFLQMGMFGPRGVTLPDKGLEIPKPPYKVQDNPDCLLDATDMVFVDPVGTGFSRATLTKGEDGKESRDSKTFWGVKEDIASLGQFIRVWLSQNKRWGAPVLLCGESYGGIRVAGLSAYLIDNEGIAPSGVIMLSPALSYADLMPDSSRWSPFIYGLPNVASTAFYYGKTDKEYAAMTPFEFRQVIDKWVDDVYAPALRKGFALSPERAEAVAADLSKFTGIPVRDILKNGLLVDLDLFVDRVLSYQGIFVSNYDTRLSAPWPKIHASWGEDPTNVLTGPPFITAWRRYLSDELGIDTSRSYPLLSDAVNAGWNFMSGSESRKMGYPNAVGDLGEAMRKLPSMKLFVASGLYDAVTPREGVLSALAHLDIPPERRANITTGLYEGGHMFYTNAAERRRFAGDLRHFIEER